MSSQSASSAIQKFCTECGAEVPGQARFCPGCGRALGGDSRPASFITSLSPRALLVVVGVSAVVLTAGWNLKSSIAGVKPTESFEEAKVRSERARMNPAITQLRQTAEAQATEPQAWKALAEALLVELRASEKPSSTLVFETIDALRKILDLQPEDPFALLNMADISLNQQVFEKAVEYYARYLAVQPTDALSRARYASALAFTGKSEQAILELEGILKDQPDNFHALAYLAVTHAQAGSVDKAREVGTRALQVAPSEEARERFNGFLASLGSSASAPPEVRGSGGPQVQNLRGGAGADSSVNAVAEHVRNNEVAGQKFSHAELRGDTLVLVFRQFPMDKMPPFIRDKFSQGIVDAARSAGVSASRVSFVDEDGQKEMHAVPLAD